MSMHYSDPERENDPFYLPSIETFKASDYPDSELEDGWYYWFCFPGCMPDSDPYGPFVSEGEALDDARNEG